LLIPGSGTQWKDDVVEQKLRSRLGDSYPEYLSTVKNMECAVDKFKERLGLSDDLKVQPTRFFEAVDG
jgi:hypothetical protein